MTKLGIDALLRPRSIAVVGASERNFFSVTLMRHLRQYAFPGTIHPVNPNRDRLFDLPCAPSITALSDTPDLAVLVVGRERVLELLEECHQKSVPAALVMASGFAESPDIEGAELQARLSAFAVETGMAICGPNCTGNASLHDRIVATSAPFFVPLRPGNVGVVSQSGAMLASIAKAAYERNVGFSHLIASGNEACLDLVDYLNFLLDDEQTSVVCGYVEGIRRPAEFTRVAEAALARRKPLVLVKIGRSEKSQATTLAHTGALTGNDQAYDALFRNYGIVRAVDIDDMLDCALLLSQIPVDRYPRGNRVGVISISGGGASLAVDLAADFGLDMPDLSAASAATIDQTGVLGLVGKNPLDLTGIVVNAAPELLPQFVQAFVDDERIDAIAGVFRLSEAYAARLLLAEPVFQRSNKPIIITTAESYQMDDWARGFLEEHRFPAALGLRRCFRTIQAAHQFAAALEAYQQGSPRRPRSAVAPSELEIGSGRAATEPRVLAGPELGRILRAAGLSVARDDVARTVGEAMAAARAIGFPVVLKVQSPDISHKSDVGGVRAGLRSEDEVATAFEEMIRRVRASCPDARLDGVLVQEMVEGVAEVYVGASFKSEPGPLLLVGLGGVFVELLRDVACDLAPVTPNRAEAMLRQLRGFPLLAGYRGRPVADLTALVEAVVRTGELAAELKPRRFELDLNPIVVLPAGQGVEVVDARLVLTTDDSQT